MFCSLSFCSSKLQTLLQTRKMAFILRNNKIMFCDSKRQFLKMAKANRPLFQIPVQRLSFLFRVRLVRTSKTSTNNQTHISSSHFHTQTQLLHSTDFVKKNGAFKINRNKSLFSKCHNNYSHRNDSKMCCFQINSFFLKRNFSSSDESAGGGTSDENLLKLPKRVVKRLHKQGLTEEQFLSKMKLSSENINKLQQLRPGKENLEEILKSMSTEPRYLSETDNFPSDIERHKRWEKEKKFLSKQPLVAPASTSVILFPGQGSQFVGMGKKLLMFPRVRDLYDEASSLLGFNLLEICLNGPKSDLDKTKYCQPAVVITSLAAIEKFREEHPQAMESCVATAGFSVGEFSALVFSGVLSFPDAVKLVKVRAEAMQHASEVVGSGMTSVFLAHDSNLSLAIKTAKEYCKERRGIENPVCIVANYLFPECKVIAGHEEAIEFIATNAKEFGLLRTKRLAVSGAFHTSLMESAVQPLQRALAGMKIGNPKFKVYSNVTNAPYHPKTNFAHMLGQQLVKPVKWEQIMHNIYSREQGLEFPNTYEVGPGRQMGTFLKQVNLQAHKQYHNVDV